MVRDPKAEVSTHAIESGLSSAVGAAVWRLVHADEACLVVVKPSGQLSVPGRGVLATGSLAEQVQSRWPDAQVVHRLDMATSGLLLFARGPDWQRAFNRMFAERAIDKGYVALVHGRLGSAIDEHGQIDLPLAADWPKRPRQKVDAVDGKPSLSRWRVLAHDPASRWTRLALSPVTGRSHQLRVHLSAVGHPVIGDALYGPVSGNGVDPCQLPAPRLMLHAQSLSFVHPAHGERLTLQSPAPF